MSINHFILLCVYLFFLFLFIEGEMPLWQSLSYPIWRNGWALKMIIYKHSFWGYICTNACTSMSISLVVYRHWVTWNLSYLAADGCRLLPRRLCVYDSTWWGGFQLNGGQGRRFAAFLPCFCVWVCLCACGCSEARPGPVQLSCSVQLICIPRCTMLVFTFCFSNKISWTKFDGCLCICRRADVFVCFFPLGVAQL